MNSPDFSVQFNLNFCEIQKLNKMYFKNIYKDRILLSASAVLFSIIISDLNGGHDLIEWIIRSLVLIILFLMVQYSFVNAVSKMLFRLWAELLKFKSFACKYQLSFTGSVIRIHSPLGNFTHSWSRIEKAVLTKDFLFLYVKDQNGYIISISKSCKGGRNIRELISFVEHNVADVVRV